MALKPEINKQLLSLMLAMFIVAAVVGTVFVFFYKLDLIYLPSYYLVLSQILLGCFIVINNSHSLINLYFFHFLLFLLLMLLLILLLFHAQGR